VIVTEAELSRWGERLGATLATPCFLALRGPLGAGKSVLARAVGRGAGLVEPMPSPTFNLCFRYDTPRGVELIHMDLYRLSDPDELWELGWEDLGAPDQLVLVEWPERAGPLLPADRWDVSLHVPEPGSTVRRVEVERVGAPPPLPGFPVTLTTGGEA